MRFIEQFEANAAMCPDRVILRDGVTSMTFREIDEMSGCVYAYLKDKGIGREQAVMIDLPRGINVFVALLGVWKVGAAGVVVEDFYPEDRKAFIYNDANCVMKIDHTNWLAIITTPSLPGHEETDVHDASEIIYTSGSEGLPKGVITEYGKLDLNLKVQGWFWLEELREDDIMLLSSPMSAVLAHMFVYFAFEHRMMVDIAPLQVVKNFTLFTEYIIDHGVTVVGMPPVYISMPLPENFPMRIALLGGDGVRNAYNEKFKTYNLYGSTESSVEVCHFLVDKNYDNTPIGFSSPYIKVMLLDDDGNEVPQGEMGEFCHEDPYTRGYINQEEQTAAVFHDGVYHTGDLARQREDGNYVILGRKTDMIKINGNRIEPAEIESAVKKVLGLRWAYAKGFKEEKRAFICVYYNEDVDIDYAETREALMKMLPSYMIPTYFARLEKVPYLPTGKVDRNALKAPQVTEYFAEYVAPTNPLEELLCNEMASILKLERIGIDDDFFLLGGDSLNTIRLVTNCNIDDLNTTDIYNHRTPRKIAEGWMMKQIKSLTPQPLSHRSTSR